MYTTEKEREREQVIEREKESEKRERKREKANKRERTRERERATEKESQRAGSERARARQRAHSTVALCRRHSPADRVEYIQNMQAGGARPSPSWSKKQNYVANSLMDAVYGRETGGMPTKY